MTARPKLVVVVTHPIQHFAPVYQAIAREGRVDLLAVFLTDAGARPYRDLAFGVTLAWDVDLLSGYRCVVLRPGLGRVPKGIRTFSFALKGILDAEDPAAVLVYGYTRAVNWTAWRWARRRRRALIYCSDSILTEGPTTWRRLIRDRLVRLYLRSVGTFLAAGDRNEAYLLHYGADRSRIVRCPLPVDIRRLRVAAGQFAAREESRRRLKIPDGSFVLLQCGKLAPHKRPMDLMEAVFHLRDKGVPALAVYAGAGQLMDEMRVQAAASRYPEAICVAGFVNQSALPRYYASADALVIASAVDAHPLVATEGAAFGLPLIVSDRVGCIGPSDVARPENSIVYPCGNVPELIRAIEALVWDSARRLQMARASEAIALEHDVSVAAETIGGAVWAACAPNWPA